LETSQPQPPGAPGPDFETRETTAQNVRLVILNDGPEQGEGEESKDLQLLLSGFVSRHESPGAPDPDFGTWESTTQNIALSSGAKFVAEIATNEVEGSAVAFSFPIPGTPR
jgi:hypothetical protein